MGGVEIHPYGVEMRTNGNISPLSEGCEMRITSTERGDPLNEDNIHDQNKINASRSCTSTLEMNTNTKIAKRPADNLTDRHIILPLRVFDTMACNRVCCAQLWAVRMISRNRRRQTYRETERRTDRHISSIGPHWG